MTVQQTSSACPHPEAVGRRWGDPIGEERQAALQGYLDGWVAETDHGERKGPFSGVPLTGADVSWLAERVRTVDNLAFDLLLKPLAQLGFTDGMVREMLAAEDLHLEDAFQETLAPLGLVEGFFRAMLPAIDLHLEGAILISAHLEGAVLILTRLDGAVLSGAHLEGASLQSASLVLLPYLGHEESSGLGPAYLGQERWR